MTQDEPESEQVDYLVAEFPQSPELPQKLGIWILWGIAGSLFVMALADSPKGAYPVVLAAIVVAVIFLLKTKPSVLCVTGKSIYRVPTAEVLDWNDVRAVTIK